MAGYHVPDPIRGIATEGCLAVLRTDAVAQLRDVLETIGLTRFVLRE